MVQAGKPVRLNFLRQEWATSAEMVLLPGFGKSARLPEGEIVPVEFCPKSAGSSSLPARWG